MTDPLHTTIEAVIRRELLRPASRMMPVSALAGHLASVVASALLASQKAADRDLRERLVTAAHNTITRNVGARQKLLFSERHECAEAAVDAVLAAIRGAGYEVAREECGGRMPATAPESAQDARDGPEA